jgi:spore coat polysaccharide biosynthesis predicted glycosyltransferase SpsG
LEVVPVLARSNHRIVFVEGEDKDEKDEATIAGNQIGQVHLLIVDNYRLGAAFESSARTWAPFVVAIDDSPCRPHAADIVVDHTNGRVPEHYVDVAPASRILAGSRYALLRLQFKQYREASLRWRGARAGRLEQVLVAFGAADPHNYSGTALDSLLRIPHIRIDVLLGASHSAATAIRSKIAEVGNRARLLDARDNVAELMATTDLAVGGVGGMSWERCAVGLPAVVIDDNNKGVAETLVKAGAAFCLGKGQEAIRARLMTAVARLSADPTRLAAMGEASAKICDGQGAPRAAEALLRAAHIEAKA